MGLFCFLLGTVAGAFVWDYAGDDIKAAIIKRRNY